jgi:hypothetical protein
MSPFIRHQFKPTRVLAYFVLIGLGALCFCYVVEVGVGIAQLAAPDLKILEGENDGSSMWLMLQSLGLLLRLPLYIFAVVIFLVWLYRSSSNLGALRTRTQEFSPGWAVGWWFIPIASLFRPFQAVREIWSQSDPEFDASLGFAPQNTGGAPAYMSFWWFFWLTSNFALNITGRVFDPDDLRTVYPSGVLFTITGVLSFAAAILLIMVVRDITTRQELRMEALSRFPPEPYAQPYGYSQPPAPPSFGGRA